MTKRKLQSLDEIEKEVRKLIDEKFADEIEGIRTVSQLYYLQEAEHVFNHKKFVIDWLLMFFMFQSEVRVRPSSFEVLALPRIHDIPDINVVKDMFITLYQRYKRVVDFALLEVFRFMYSDAFARAKIENPAILVHRLEGSNFVEFVVYDAI